MEKEKSIKIIWIDNLILLRMYPLSYEDCPEWLQTKIKEIDEIFKNMKNYSFQRLGMAFTVRSTYVIDAINNNDEETINKLSDIHPTLNDADILISYWYKNHTHYGAIWNAENGLKICDIYTDASEEWMVLNPKLKK